MLAALGVLAALVVLPAAVYLASYAQYFAAGHTWADFVELHRQALYFSTHLKAGHTYASIAPTWIVVYRPVWYYFQGTADDLPRRRRHAQPVPLVVRDAVAAPRARSWR